MELFNRYVIDNDSYSTILKQKTTRVDKEGFPIYDVIGYYSTTEHCVKGLLNYLLKQKTKSDSKINDVKGIIEVIEQTKEELISELKKINV